MGNKEHYDNVTDAWIYILGDNLHYGYFKNETVCLEEATNELINKLASLAEISENTLILDVGCGIGNPAFYLHEKFGCSVLGISISPRGIEIADKKCREQMLLNNIQFFVRDALNNGFPDDCFDIVWVMESSHLIRNKKRLFQENYRVLKQKGCMLLCDLILLKNFTVKDIFTHVDKLEILQRSFGNAKLETPEFYKQLMLEQGFKNVQLIDISKEVIRTATKWKENALEHKANILKLVDDNAYNDFLISYDIIYNFFINDVLGYCLIKGEK